MKRLHVVEGLVLIGVVGGLALWLLREQPQQITAHAFEEMAPFVARVISNDKPHVEMGAARPSTTVLGFDLVIETEDGRRLRVLQQFRDPRHEWPERMSKLEVGRTYRFPAADPAAAAAGGVR